MIDNRGGAGGLIGSAAVASAPPDGYTLLLVSATFTINPAVKKAMPFDTIRDFTPVAFIARSPLLVTASNKLPVQIREGIARSGEEQTWPDHLRLIGSRQHQPDCG